MILIRWCWLEVSTGVDPEAEVLSMFGVKTVIFHLSLCNRKTWSSFETSSGCWRSMPWLRLILCPQMKTASFCLNRSLSSLTPSRTVRYTVRRAHCSGAGPSLTLTRLCFCGSSGGGCVEDVVWLSLRSRLCPGAHRMSRPLLIILISALLPSNSNVMCVNARLCLRATWRTLHTTTQWALTCGVISKWWEVALCSCNVSCNVHWWDQTTVVQLVVGQQTKGKTQNAKTYIGKIKKLFFLEFPEE